MRLNSQTNFLPLVKPAAPGLSLPEGPHAERSYRGASGPRRGAPPAETDIRTRDTCQKFEGFLLGEMLKTMRGENTESKGIIPTSRGERIFIRQQCETLGDTLGRTEPLGMRRILVGDTDEARPAGHDAAPSALPERGQS